MEPTPAADEHTPDWMGRLARPERQLRLMAENLRDVAIFFLDPLGRVSDWTPSAQALLGHATEAVIGQPAAQFIDPGDSQAGADLGDALARAALLGQSEARGWQRRADGQRFWASTVLTHLDDPTQADGRGFACLMRDMTEVRQLLDQLQSVNTALEARVAQRTQALSESTRDLEAFSSSVSHDLRAPLRHITSFLGLLRESLGQAVPEDAAQHLHTIEQSAQHMGQLIEGLLAFSRLGQAALQPQPLAMSALLAASLHRVEHDPALRRTDGEVEWLLPSDLPTVPGDPLLLSQVWDNLLANALKYSRPRTPARIHVSAHRDSQQVVFRVQDNGVGFDPRRAHGLFGMFQRLHPVRQFEGTGIGLALCRRIIERHGGRIWAEAAPEAGCTVSFSLPVKAPQ
jgi:PAS domain S-box-containing protein